MVRSCCCIAFLLCISLASCSLEGCGNRKVSDSDVRTESPWSVAIFLRSRQDQNFRFFLTGTILSPYTVLSLNGGRFGNGRRKRFIPNPKNLKIVAALSTTRLEDQDLFSQSPDVQYIIPYTGHTSDNKLFHFYLIRLKTPLNLATPFVRAICLPRHDDQLWNSSSSSLYLGGYSPKSSGTKTFNHLNSQKIFVLDKSKCLDYASRKYPNRIPSSPQCGRAHNGSQTDPCILHGGAIYYKVLHGDSPRTEKWFLFGTNVAIPSLKLRKCNADSTFLIGSLDDSLQWILNNLKCEPSRFACNSGKCIPWESLCNGYDDCGLGSSNKHSAEDEHEVFCRASDECKLLRGSSSPIPYHRCGLFQECIDQELVCNGVPNCRNGADELNCNATNQTYQDDPKRDVSNQTKQFNAVDSTDLVPVEINLDDVSCRLMQLGEGVVSKCRRPLNDEEIPCSEAMASDEMKLECDYQYRPKGRHTYAKLSCGSDGMWRMRRKFACELDCGIINSGFTSFLTFGKRTSTKQAFPWYAALYLTKVVKNLNPGQREFICGGSLIERNVVLTAAHCVTDANGQKLPVTSLTIVLSPISGVFEANLNDTYAQILEVNSIHVPVNYDPKNLQSDIAIVELKGSASFNNFVRPVCYLPPFYKDLTPGIMGKIAGLGYDENRVVSKVVKFLSFPVVSNDECVKAFREVPPLNTFCAGYRNGTAVCKGDSGGGLVFPVAYSQSQFERYVLKGIVSHADSSSLRVCDMKNYSVFTYVDAFGEWILEVLRDIDKMRRDK